MAHKLTAALALAASVAAVPATGGAQTLQRLTVQSFTLSTDASQAGLTARPYHEVALDQPFHLVISLNVREHVAQIYNLELPMLAQLELLGDERTTLSGPRGTQYREVITVIAHNSGTITIDPAILQARDATDGKAKQWYTNGLTIFARPSATQSLQRGTRVALDVLAPVVTTLLILAIVVGSILLAVRLGRRAQVRAAFVQPAPVAEPIPAPRPRTRAEQVHDAFLVLNADRTRSGALRVRSAIWRMIGAPEGETLGDTLRRPGANEAPLKDVLVSLERSAFTYDEDLAQGIADACGALERYAAALGAGHA